MKYFLLISLLIASLSGTFAQKSDEVNYILNQDDSLKIICKKISELDSLKFNFYYNNNPDESEVKLFNSLINYTLPYQLLILTNHNSPIVKIYAYRGLNETNKVLLMEALRQNKKDTSILKISHFYKSKSKRYEYYDEYYKEIYGNRIKVIDLALKMTYENYSELLSKTLNDKDWKYIQKQYEKVLKSYVKNFESYNKTIKGTAINIKFGAIIKLENGNFYYLKKRYRWMEEEENKTVIVKGNINISYRLSRYSITKYGEAFGLPTGENLRKTIEVEEIEFI